MDEIIQIAQDIIDYLKTHEKCHIKCKYDYTIILLEKEVKKLTDKSILFICVNDCVDINKKELNYIVAVEG